MVTGARGRYMGPEPYSAGRGAAARGHGLRMVSPDKWPRFARTIIFLLHQPAVRLVTRLEAWCGQCILQDLLHRCPAIWQRDRPSGISGIWKFPVEALQPNAPESGLRWNAALCIVGKMFRIVPVDEGDTAAT